MMDVAKYNQVEQGEYLKPKYWAKQRERNIYCYLEADGQVLLNAEFSDGKSMWVSTDTKSSDVEIHTAILERIMETMNEAPSEWYASTFNSVRTAIRLGADRVARACELTAHLQEDKYMDFAQVWHNNTSDAARTLAMQISDVFIRSRSCDAATMQILREIKHKLDAFAADGNRLYRYSSIQPYVDELQKYKYLKIAPDAAIRSLYTGLENCAAHLYNEYQSNMR